MTAEEENKHLKEHIKFLEKRMAELRVQILEMLADIKKK